MAEKYKVGIGFAAGRKHFQRILRSYVYNWTESEPSLRENVSLNLFVAYDTDYKGTKREDYVRIRPEVSALLDDMHFIGTDNPEQLKGRIAAGAGIDARDAALLFGRGYAAQRNLILYSALKNGMDCILFLDDDEYPVSMTRIGDNVIWGGEPILPTHLRYIRDADLTCGFHCGYVSPIPHVRFNGKLKEADFREFIGSLSNDILNWKSMKQIMKNDGVTYADRRTLIQRRAFEAKETNHTKFISGSNLCVNLRRPERVFPFFNPPGARGEDTFLSTCLSERKVMRVPTYTFHDGFGVYTHILSGVLPRKFKCITPESGEVVARFYRACLGWIRYKPLYLYLTDPAHYDRRIAGVYEGLTRTLPKICAYFKTDRFMTVRRELKKYDASVQAHAELFQRTKEAWQRLMRAQ